MTLAHTYLGEAHFGPFSENDVVLPAHYALQREINVRLSDYAAVPQLTWTSDKHGQHQRIIFRLPNLLSAMWLQFAQAVTSEFQLKKCPVCHTYFQAGPGARRIDAITCGGKCRQAKRKARGKATANVNEILGPLACRLNHAEMKAAVDAAAKRMSGTVLKSLLTAWERAEPYYLAKNARDAEDLKAEILRQLIVKAQETHRSLQAIA